MGQEVGRYYIEFINKLMIGVGSKKKIVTLSDLRDGVVLCEILLGIQGIELRGRYNEEAVGFVEGLGNLRTIVKQIESYWGSVLGLSLSEEIDIIQVCKATQQQELIRLVKLIIRTLFLSPQKQQYIERILQTTQETQTYFMQLINQQQNISQSLIPSPHSNNSPNTRLYRRLQELQRENDKLLKVIQETQHQLQKSKQLCKESDQKTKQNQRLIYTLSQQLKMLKIHLYQNQQRQQQQLLLNSNDIKMQSKIEEKLIEFREQQKTMHKEMQRLKQLVETQSVQLQKLNRKNSQLRDYETKHNQIANYNQLLQQKLEKFQAKTLSLQKQLQLSLQSNRLNDQQILSMKKSLLESETMIGQKNEFIQQLENNIKYLIEESQPMGSQSQLNHNNGHLKNDAQKTTLKQQFQSTIASNRQHMILTKLTEQNIFLNKQLKSIQQVNCKLQHELQQLAIAKQQNQKLVQMISHMHKYRGEENQLLVKTIYRMRVKMLQGELLGISGVNATAKRGQDHMLKDINREY